MTVSIGRKRSSAIPAKLTTQERSDNLRKSAATNGAKIQEPSHRNKNIVQKIDSRKKTEKSAVVDTADKALANLLQRLRTTVNPNEIRQLSDQIEQVIFHKQFANA